jgi:putative MATE family efflux protein
MSKLKQIQTILAEAFRGSNRDFTEGSIGTAVFLLSVPMIFEMLGESLFAVVDIFYVGKLGATAVAVIGITETALVLIYAVAIGLSIGATATIARRIGEKEPEEAAKTGFHVIVLGVIVSAIIAIIGVIFAPNFLQLLGAETAVIELGTTYARIMLGTNFVILFLFLLNAIFRGAGDATVSMRVLWLANILNIILAPIFIFYFDFGVTGAAIGTSIGRGIGVIYAFAMLWSNRGRITIELKHCKFEPILLWNLVKLSASAVLQFTIGTASWIGLMKVISKFGSEAVAGYTIGVRVIVFALLPSIGMSNAAATLVGQNLGAERPDRAEKSVWTAAFYNAIFLTSIGILFIIFANPIISIFTHESNVVNCGTDTLRIVSYGFIFYSVGMVLESAFNGAGDTWTPTYLNFFVFWMFEIPLAYVLANYFDLKTHGVLWAITIAFSTLAVVSLIIFRRGKWKLKIV